MERHTAKRHANSEQHFDLHKDFSKVKGALRDATRDAKDKASAFLSASYDDMKKNTTELRGHVSDYVTEKPLKSLGIALLSGVVLGFFLRR